MQTTQLGATPSVQAFDNKPSQDIGQEDFLIMLITQLENQDPLDPQDASEFTAQLAQFSSLDQLVSMRTAIDGLAAGQLTSQNLSVASLVGRNVLVETSSIDVNAQTNPSLVLDLASPGDITVHLVDSGGRVASSANLQNLPPGRNEIALSSFNSAVPAGKYKIRVDSTGPGASATTLVRSTVTGASFESGSSTLLLGGVEVALANLRELKQ